MIVKYVLFVHRMQALKQPIYTQKEADMAAGMGNYALKQPDTSFTDIDMKDHDSIKDSSQVRTD